MGGVGLGEGLEGWGGGGGRGTQSQAIRHQSVQAEETRYRTSADASAKQICPKRSLRLAHIDIPGLLLHICFGHWFGISGRSAGSKEPFPCSLCGNSCMLSTQSAREVLWGSGKPIGPRPKTL